MENFIFYVVCVFKNVYAEELNELTKDIFRILWNIYGGDFLRKYSQNNFHHRSLTYF